MPTIKRNRRGFRARTPLLTSEAAINEMLESPEYPNSSHPSLAGFPEAERPALVAEALQRHWATRESARLPVLLERLQRWTVDKWGEIFAECPDLEESLTADQRAAWSSWLDRAE